jgi:hypothetical protein
MLSQMSRSVVRHKDLVEAAVKQVAKYSTLTAGSTKLISAATQFNSPLITSLANRAKTYSPYPHLMLSTRLKTLPRVNTPQPAEALAELDYRLPPSDFNHQAFAALKHKSGFVLSNLPPEFSMAANNLLSAFDDFRAQPEEAIAKYAADGSFNGHHKDGSFLFGSKIGPRFFIGRDKEQKISHSLPMPLKAKVGMKEADDKLSGYTDEILKKVIAAMESGFGLPKGQFSAVFQGYDTKTSLNHNTPITQNKLQQWIAKNKLTLTEDGRVESFLAHQDLVPLSILIYRNNETNGLELEYPDKVGVRTFHPVKLNGEKQGGMRAIVILGRPSEILTDGLMQGSPHRVVGTPLKSGEIFSRDSINIFVFVDPNLLLKPVLTSPGGPKFAPISMPEFYTSYSKSYMEAADKAAVHELPASVMNAFPKDEDVQVVQTQNGPGYRRR